MSAHRPLDSQRSGDAPAVDELRLRGGDAGHLRTLDALPSLTTLCLLDVSGNLLTSLAPLAQSSSLTDLDASRNMLACLNGLRGLGSLTRLDCSGNVLEHVPAWMGSAMPQLEELGLAHNRLSSLRELRALRPLRHLHRLSVLRGNAGLERLPNARGFVITHCAELQQLEEQPVTLAEVQEAAARHPEELEALSKELAAAAKEIAGLEAAAVRQAEVHAAALEAAVAAAEARGRQHARAQLGAVEAALAVARRQRALSEAQLSGTREELHAALGHVAVARLEGSSDLPVEGERPLKGSPPASPCCEPASLATPATSPRCEPAAPATPARPAVVYRARGGTGADTGCGTGGGTGGGAGGGATAGGDEVGEPSCGTFGSGGARSQQGRGRARVRRSLGRSPSSSSSVARQLLWQEALTSEAEVPVGEAAVEAAVEVVTEVAVKQPEGQVLAKDGHAGEEETDDESDTEEATGTGEATGARGATGTEGGELPDEGEVEAHAQAQAEEGRCTDADAHTARLPASVLSLFEPRGSQEAHPNQASHVGMPALVTERSPTAVSTHAGRGESESAWRRESDDDDEAEEEEGSRTTTRRGWIQAAELERGDARILELERLVLTLHQELHTLQLQQQQQQPPPPQPPPQPPPPPAEEEGAEMPQQRAPAPRAVVTQAAETQTQAGDQAVEAAAASLKAEAAIAAAREEAAAAVVAQQRAECVAADEGRVACAAEEMLRATRAQLGELEAACSLGQCLLASKGQQLEALRQLLEQKMSQGRASHSGMQGCAAARHLPKAIRAIYPLDASGFS